MRLKQYRVTNFRSVDDSGPIDVDDVTALIGTNESGKTNLLLPLWKLKPAKGGEISATADYPRKHYNDFRNLEEKPRFVEATFEIPTDLARQLSSLSPFPIEMFDEVVVIKTLDDQVSVNFPNVKPPRQLSQARISELLDACRSEIESATALKSEIELKTNIIN